MAAEAIRTELLRLGYDDAGIEGWPSDGSRRYYTYRSVIGWRARKAELGLLGAEVFIPQSYDWGSRGRWTGTRRPLIWPGNARWRRCGWCGAWPVGRPFTAPIRARPNRRFWMFTSTPFIMAQAHIGF